MKGLLVEIARPPIASESSCDIIGIHVAPPFTDFQTPPLAAPAQTTFSVTGWTTRLLIRPLTFRGPSDVHSSGKRGQTIGGHQSFGGHSSGGQGQPYGGHRQYGGQRSSRMSHSRRPRSGSSRPPRRSRKPSKSRPVGGRS